MAIRITNKSTVEVGQTVGCHPATNAWMQGDRYGSVVEVGEAFIYVRMFRSEKMRKFIPSDIVELAPVNSELLRVRLGR